MRLSIGSLLGPYEVTGPLGSGGMGEVYRARDTRLDRDVAVKVLPDGMADDRDALQRFEREAKAVAALSHPNIVAIHDFGSDRGIVYTVTELLEGQTLRRQLGDASLPWPRAVEIAIALADGLAAAHAKGVVHRDLKPENIFILSDGRVKILDFGLAHTESPRDDHGETLTQPGTVMGTVGYMAPEQVRGEPARAVSDIFALGAVLYEMVAGRRAFAAPTPQETLSAILRDDPPDLAQMGTPIPDELAQIVSHCLEKRPGERFQSARDLAFALKTAASRRSADRVSTTHAIDSIAVLPFTNVTRDPEVDYLADGVTETIINSLARLPGVRVSPRSTVFRYQGQEADAQSVGRELGVRVVLTGRIVQRGDTLVVGAELVDVARQCQLWGERFTRKLADIFAIEEDIARRISDSLSGALTGDDRARLARRSTDDSEAYRLYLKGRHAFYRRTPASLQQGLRCFEQAIERDPNYALAYSGLCDSHALLGWMGVVRWSDAYARCREAAGRAVAANQGLAEAHVSLGMVRMIDWQWAESEREFRRAIQLNPSYFPARTWFAFMVLGPLGRYDEAIAQLRLALDAEPLSQTVHSHAAMVYLEAREPNQAIEHARSCLELDPGFVLAHVWLGIAHHFEGRHAEAVAELETAVGLLGEAAAGWRGALACALAAAGRRREAEAIVADLRERARRGYIDPFWIGAGIMGLEQPDHALESFEQAADDRSTHLVFQYGLLHPLRAHPRFAALMQRMGLPPDPGQFLRAAPL